MSIIIIIIKISDASPSGKNRTFTKLQSNPTSTRATGKKRKQTLRKQTKINSSLKTTQRTRVKHRGREIVPNRTCAGRKHLPNWDVRHLGISSSQGWATAAARVCLTLWQVEAAHHINSVSDCCEFCTRYTFIRYDLSWYMSKLYP